MLTARAPICDMPSYSPKSTIASRDSLLLHNIPRRKEGALILKRTQLNFLLWFDGGHSKTETLAVNCGVHVSTECQSLRKSRMTCIAKRIRTPFAALDYQGLDNGTIAPVSPCTCTTQRLKLSRLRTSWDCRRNLLFLDLQ